MTPRELETLVMVAIGLAFCSQLKSEFAQILFFPEYLIFASLARIGLTDD